MEWNDDNIMYFRWITDCKNPFDDYVVFMMDLRGHFDYRIGWLLLYYRVNENFAFIIVPLVCGFFTDIVNALVIRFFVGPFLVMIVSVNDLYRSHLVFTF